MHINQQAVIATSYIGKEGDEKNRCFLSKETLFVRYRNRLESFTLESITGIYFKHKLLLLPVVIGGIISPLCMLALLKTLGNPWVVLSGLVLGLLLIYYGYEGSPTLSIATKVKEFDFFIKKPTPNLKAFAKYASQIYQYGERGSLFYLTITSDQNLNDSYINFEQEQRLYYYEEAMHSNNSFSIDPLAIPENLKLVLKENEIVPVISGKVSTDYIIPLADS